MNAPRTPAEIIKERFAAAVIHTPHSAPDSQHAEEDPDLHRNAPRPDPACLYGLLGRVAEAGSATTEANPYAVAFNALVYLSAGIGRGPFLPVGNTWHHANLFGLHVGRSGRGRKGDAAGLVHRIDRALQDRGTPEAFQVWRSGLSTREGLVSLIHDGYTEGKNEVPPINDKRLCVFESEFVNVLHQGKREGNTLSAALRDAWDGVSIKPATKSAKIGATDPHIAIVGAVTPSELRTSMAARELTNGFANRFVMIFAERTRLVPFPEATSQDVVNGLAAEFGRTFEFAQAGRWVEKDTMRVSLSPAAAALYASLYRELCNEVGGPAVFPLLERRAPVLLRIALILAMTDRTAIIERHHIEAAHAWVRFWTESVLYVFAEAADEEASRQTSETSHRIADFIRAKGEVTRKQITVELFKGHVPKDRIDAALDELLGSSPPVAVVREVRGAGRPAKFYSMAAN
ncbi:MAG: hypothetical protein ACRCTM_12320 [Sphaerotilus sulfidivorans]|uniref:hypothetical protein n=1 Tax=Sphaerotilus sulfidivorans TaxID=639200 RepID=UPI003F32D0A1